MTKAQKKRTYKINYEIMNVLCSELEISVTEFHSKSFRLKKNKVTVDYFPATGRLFTHSNRYWETIDNIENYLLWLGKQ